jgi:hypothetical protein
MAAAVDVVDICNPLGPLYGHQSPPDVLERFLVWRVRPRRFCRWVGCERPTEFVLIFSPPTSQGGRPPLLRHLPICAECAAYGLGIDVIAVAVDRGTWPPLPESN